MTPRRSPVALLAAGLLALSAPAAHATSGYSRYQGGCGFDANSSVHVNGRDRYDGVVYALVAVYSGSEGNVVNATVSCELLVNGVVQARTSGSGSGVVSFAGPLSYTAADSDSVVLCDVVDFTSDATPTIRDCYDDPGTQFPPQELIDTLEWGLGIVSEYVDPAFCAVSGGDVYVAGELWWDCPPYVTPPPSYAGPSGLGWNDGDAGFQTLFRIGVAATCGFRADRSGGTVAVSGAAVTDRAAAAADVTRLRCVLKDAATGTVLYDRTETSATRLAAITDTLPAPAGKVTVCTEASGTWGADTVTVGLYCRPGLPV